jgi:hypothetical protein
MESPQEQRRQTGNNRKGDPLAETKALGGVGHGAILQAEEPGATLVIRDRSRFGACFVADSRLMAGGGGGRSPFEVTNGVIEGGCSLPHLWTGNSEIGAFPLRPD